MNIQTLFFSLLLLWLSSAGQAFAQADSTGKKTVPATTKKHVAEPATAKSRDNKLPAKKSAAEAAAKKPVAKAGSRTSSSRSGRPRAAAGKGKGPTKASRALVARRLQQLNRAFVASATLKPMARQLLQSRTCAAYAGVEVYARRHAQDDAGALAGLVLGYGHILDHDYGGAIAPLQKARAHAGDLSDYVTYFLGTAYGGSGQVPQAVATLRDFDTRYPDSLFLRDAMVTYGNALVANQQAAHAAAVLEQYRNPIRPDFELALGRAYVRSGEVLKGGEILRRLYFTQPLAPEAADAGEDLVSLAPQLPPASYLDRKSRADLLAQARHYADAAREYSDLLPVAPVQELRNVQVAQGVALHRSGNDQQARSILESVSDAADEAGAQRLLALADMARAADDEDRFTEVIGKMRQTSSGSPAFAEALLSGANRYLLRHDYDRAIDYYRELQQRFPTGKYGSYAHWKTAWLSLRQGRTLEAKQAFEEQIERYPASPEVPSALYWRARLAEEDHDLTKAQLYYEKLAERFQNYYYANLARQRLSALHATADPPRDPLLEKIPRLPSIAAQPMTAPPDDLRAERSRLLENAGMVDFAIRELRLAAGNTGASWATRQIVQLYQDDGSYSRALQYLKRALPSYYAVDMASLPKPIWEGLFPRPYWTDLKRYSAANGLDPYLVASLIRQESEFNPGAVSRANAYGLMQLLPGTARKVSRDLRMRRFAPTQLLSPTINIELGARFFRQMVDHYNGKVEYALAAYNAGPDRVDTWLSLGTYRDTQEFVESIPFTETREYVQAIMRNASVYRRLYGLP